MSPAHEPTTGGYDCPPIQFFFHQLRSTSNSVNKCALNLSSCSESQFRVYYERSLGSIHATLPYS